MERHTASNHLVIDTVAEVAMAPLLGHFHWPLSEKKRQGLDWPDVRCNLKQGAAKRFIADANISIAALDSVANQ